MYYSLYISIFNYNLVLTFFWFASYNSDSYYFQFMLICPRQSFSESWNVWFYNYHCSSNYSLDLYHIFASSLVINLSYTKSCTEEIRRACVDHRAEYTQLGNTFAQGVNLYNDGDENEVKTNVESMSVDAHQPSTGGQISIFQVLVSFILCFRLRSLFAK